MLRGAALCLAGARTDGVNVGRARAQRCALEAPLFPNTKIGVDGATLWKHRARLMVSDGTKYRPLMPIAASEIGA